MISNHTKLISNEFLQMLQVLEEFMNTKSYQYIEECAKLMVRAIQNEKKIISCGNGGSMCDAMHFAEEMTGKFRKNRKSLPALAISDPSYITCVLNDYGNEYIFSRFVEGVGNKGDILLAISTSGNSKNVVNAAISAKEKGINVVGLTGNNGGNLSIHCDIEIRVPNNYTADRIQEVHIKVIHTLILLIEKELFNDINS